MTGLARAERINAGVAMTGNGRTAAWAAHAPAPVRTARPAALAFFAQVHRRALPKPEARPAGRGDQGVDVVRLVAKLATKRITGG